MRSPQFIQVLIHMFIMTPLPIALKSASESLTGWRFEHIVVLLFHPTSDDDPHWQTYFSANEGQDIVSNLTAIVLVHQLLATRVDIQTWWNTEVNSHVYGLKRGSIPMVFMFEHPMLVLCEFPMVWTLHRGLRALYDWAPRLRALKSGTLLCREVTSASWHIFSGNLL